MNQEWLMGCKTNGNPNLTKSDSQVTKWRSTTYDPDCTAPMETDAE